MWKCDEYDLLSGAKRENVADSGSPIAARKGSQLSSPFSSPDWKCRLRPLCTPRALHSDRKASGCGKYLRSHVKPLQHGQLSLASMCFSPSLP